ncbi:MAG TPA: hypothetical protein DIT47_06845 [Flavobacteriaceae bacterium]|nr:hypothetical protein [Flavobacteriaceae bacterium]
MTKKLYIGLGILFTISISIFVFNAIYQGSIPKIVEEINNSSIGAILTAIITVLLLSQQSSSEEVKERNVRVFEEKSNKFNSFIEKLWEIWDDRVVSLEELNEIIKMVSKDIVLYTKPETVDIILSKLITIAEQASPDKSNLKNSESTKIIQQNIFDIINELAKEIGLGGELRPAIRTKLNVLENKVVPFLIQKDFKKNYIENFKQTIEQFEDIDFSSIEYKNKFLWCRVKDSNVYFRVGPLEREKDQNIQFTFYVEFWSNRKFQKYRDASKGFRKDFLVGSNWWFSGKDFVNFSNYEQVEKMHHELTQNSNNKIAQKVAELYKNWKADGKNIDVIIEECTNT